MKLPKLLEPRVAGFDPDPDDDSVFVTLTYGWCFEPHPTNASHAQGFGTPEEAIQGIKGAMKCTCKDCSSFSNT